MPISFSRQKKQPPPARTVSPDEFAKSCTFPSGDIRVRLKLEDETQVIGRISSHAMSLASPVWKNFAYPPWNAADSGPVEELDFTEDDPNALLLLLQVIHFEFAPVKEQKPGTDQIYQLAILCDKYDCVHLVGPWLDDWLEKAESIDVVRHHTYLLLKRFRGGDNNSACKEVDSEKWLFIAWVFGKQEIFEQTAKNKLLRACTNEEGQLLTFKNELAPEAMPPDVLKQILSLRLAALEKLLDIVYRRVRGFADNKEIHCPREGVDKNRKACDAIIYGSLIRGLELVDLQSTRDLQDIKFSINQVSSKIKNLEIHSLNPFHESCFERDFEVQVDSVLSNLGNPVLDSHRRHMEEQQRKLKGRVVSQEASMKKPQVAED
ncbi:uncharacterized protein PAC_04537 [Phialocephala subalpina]|uniref:BTB domain-containing protein n=1 Tax=Phialocephala subalpina TaxID=576137 RepID=A0A1L7WPF3_9HELO|nr:uncharacterized protein PAC_04537 [Phialocephala subalpina]